MIKAERSVLDGKGIPLNVNVLFYAMNLTWDAAVTCLICFNERHTASGKSQVVWL